MMDYTISERGCADEAMLRVVDVKAPVTTGPVVTVQQFPTKTG